MVSNELGIQLHNRAAQGKTLTAKEQVQLESWYVAQDAADAELLKVAQVETDRLARENERTKQFLEASDQTFASLQRDLDAWQRKLQSWESSDQEPTSR